MKKIKVDYNHHLYSELQIRYNRILEIHGYPGGILPFPRPPSPLSGGAGKPNLANPGFVIQYISNSQQIYIILAWNPTTLPPNCEGFPGSASEYWEPGVVSNTKVYRDGSLEDGVWFSIPIGGSDGSSWGLMFDSLNDGRLLVATGLHIYRETAKESNEFEIVATVANNMDPAFLVLSPNKQKVALGLGYGQPLLVFPVDILDSSSPPLLIDENENLHPEVTAYNVNYYSAAWKDNRYLFVDGGTWPGPPYVSGIGMLDTNVPNDTGVGIVTNIPGSSSGICFDKYGNFFCGIGYSYDDPSLTGKIYYFTNNEIASAMEGAPLNFAVEGHYLCQSLSAGHMLVTPNDELIVGGGDAFGTTQHVGYAEVFKLAYDENGYISVVNSQQLILDPCQNDSAAGPLCLIKEE